MTTWGRVGRSAERVVVEEIAGDPRAAEGDLEAAIAFPNQPKAAAALARRLRGRTPLFMCVVGHTDTCLIPGISAAGASVEVRPLTPAADAEALVYGRARSLVGVPSNPLGPPGPALISVAALRAARITPVVVDAGTRIRPQAPALVLGTRPGRVILSGRAVPDARLLFRRGLSLGRRLAAQADYLVIGESVPGGTTTALAVLLGLGYAAQGKVSSSMSQNNHALKESVARRALEAAGLEGGSAEGSSDPLEVLARVGDPMQPAVAGLALGALERGPVLLAGGTQMVAVVATMAALEARDGRKLPTDRLAVATTRWVVDDPTSDFRGLLAAVGPIPALCTTLSFGTSAYAELRRYEEFLVKEGVGAGGAAVAAWLAAGIGVRELRECVEQLYGALLSE